MMSLRGRGVVVTGAAGGIGAPLCAELLAAGACVLAVGRDAARLAPLAGGSPHGRLRFVEADVSTSAGREQVRLAAGAMRPAASVLVVAHAQGGFGLFEDQDPDTLSRLMQVNLVSPMLLIRAMLPLLSAQPQASVAVVGSTFGSLAFPGFAAYSASKFGLRGLVEALSREYAGSLVRFQYLAPRATRTAFNTAQVDALNAELKVSTDAPADVARRLVEALQRGTPRLQLGRAERLFARINALVPGLVDRDLRARLPIIRRHARRPSHLPTETRPHALHAHELPAKEIRALDPNAHPTHAP